MQTKIYRLLPIARADDPNWDLKANQGEVVVRAVSSGDARLVASYAEIAAFGYPEMQGKTQVSTSAFRDENLYHVVEDSNDSFPCAGPRTVLKANFRVPENFVPAAD